MRPDQLERRIRERLDALGPAPRAELLHVLMLPDLERAERIGEFWSFPQSRSFAELLIDCEEDRTFRAMLVGMQREGRQGSSGQLGDERLEESAAGDGFSRVPRSQRRARVELAGAATPILYIA
jgi:hypothetical protein